MKKRLTKWLGILGLSLIASGCTNYSVVNVPFISNNYRYVTLSVSDFDLYNEIRDQLARQDIMILDANTPQSQLKQVVNQVNAAMQAANKQVPKRRITYLPTSQNANPLGITSISQCSGENLNFSCVQNFIPHVNIQNYTQTTSVLSRLPDGSTGQVLYLGAIVGEIDLPTLGVINLRDIQNDIQLNDDTQPLAQVRASAQSTQLLKKAVAESIVGKIVFVLEDQTLREIKKQ
ncbi:hypothetical protein CJP74_00560 [Psittacicella melopsittaci]|uniref:Lipoprotein n=1 Tax=Psittacicella melopsittaci TaxID=2028576 RepID=A0A3A1Y9Q2_9GAMM|nr:hypothetical protein [Psittacicella melopsittaci]RIY33949.1 hypothetical protein CJP74_00560 [Psittacicella melopsittaci]